MLFRSSAYPFGLSAIQSDRSADISPGVGSNLLVDVDSYKREVYTSRPSTSCWVVGLTNSGTQGGVGGVLVSLKISTRESDDITIVELAGKSTLESHGAHEFSRHVKRLVADGKHKILLNLSELTQIDSSGVSVIVETWASLRNRRGELKLMCPRGRVQEVLRVIRLVQVIPSFENESEALASFHPKGYAAQI